MRGAGAVLLLTALLSWTPFVFADPTPGVDTFTVSPSYIENNGTILLSWTAGSATGVDLYFACPTGVMIMRNGTSFPCNARQSYSSNMTDSGSFIAANVSGSTQSITVTAYPKDSLGNDYDAGAMSTTFMVMTSAAPIKNFTLSSQSITSGKSVTLAWTALDALGVNFEFDCNPNVQISIATANGLQGLPCGAAAFSPDLSLSGTTTVTAQNTSWQPITIAVHVVPQIALGAYDMTHARSASLTINPRSSQSPPTTMSFSSTPASVAANVAFTLSWTTQNAAGANIEFICTNGAITAAQLVGTTTSALPCNVPIFSSALPPSGNTAIEIVQAVPGSNATFELLPEGDDGTYYAMTSRTISIPIVSSSTSLTRGAQPIAVMNTPAASTTPASWHHYTFIRALHRGSQNADVTALQKYLALDPGLYPLGIVSGYFGAATMQAVELFQAKFGIAAPGDSGYGSVGPKTRNVLNTLQ